MTVTAPCKTPGCSGEVTYEAKEIMAFSTSKSDLDKSVTIYLECTNGHTNKYILEDGSLK